MHVVGGGMVIRVGRDSKVLAQRGVEVHVVGGGMVIRVWRDSKVLAQRRVEVHFAGGGMDTKCSGDTGGIRWVEENASAL